MLKIWDKKVSRPELKLELTPNEKRILKGGQSRPKNKGTKRKTDPLAPILKGLRGKERTLTRKLLENQMKFLKSISKLPPLQRLAAIRKSTNPLLRPVVTSRG